MSVGGYIRRKTYWISDFLKGSPVKTQFDDIDIIINNKEEGAHRTRKYLKELLEHAASRSEFYKDYKGCDLSCFPVMDKMRIVENYDNIFIKEWWNGKNGNIARTSGSTGVPLKIHQDYRKRNRVIAELKYFGERCGYKSHEKMAHVRVWVGREKTWWQQFTQNIIGVDISDLSPENLFNIVTLCKKKKIRAITSYANAMEVLVQFIKENSVSVKGHRIKTIICGAETLLPETREGLQNIFGCTVVSKYSNSENGIFSQEPSEDGSFLLNHASYFFEVLKLDADEPANHGEPGRIVVTDFFNYAFPMIRYDTGDLGILAEPDDKETHRIVLKSIFGRQMEVVLTTNNKPVNPMFFWLIMRGVEEIKQWQFVQKSQLKYVLKISEFSPVSLEIQLAKMKEILGADAEITVEISDEIPTLAAGKRRMVVNETSNRNKNI